MRKSQLKEINSLSDTLKNAHSKVDKSVIEENPEILMQCQECAIAIGNSIEESEGEGTDSVALLEEYCEMLYQLSIEESDIKWRSINENIKDILLQIDKTLQEINIKLEVVFLPYKASMWDSLESVWMAAEEDENCNALVIPIPYFDKNPDGSLGQMHYEGNDYPDYVPVISWEAYNLEEQKPDMIFIHNPYDNCNYVTTVHPKFYASNIHDFTENLVYIPYFVLEEIELNNKEAIESIKHFCYLPGTIFADKVIVQSENMRQIYIDEFIKFAKENGSKIDKKVIENRFVGIGSPKFDKVNSECKEQYVLPEEWKKIILKPDGSQKKIIFYNTSINALLQHNEKMLYKIRYVLKVFKERQKDVVLWWRPHPLIESTIASMRTKLWEDYMAIVEDYRNGAWGIYDNTPDVHRAIAISDAYYGDISSVVQMYQNTEKLIMIQNVYLVDSSNS